MVSDQFVVNEFDSTQSKSDAALTAQIRANEEAIERLRAHVTILEHRMSVMVIELKRQRENPLPESVYVKPKTVLHETVLKIAPKAEGQTKATVRSIAASRPRGTHAFRTVERSSTQV
jgi:hypothetical protein